MIRACRAMGRDHDRLINGSVQGFRGPGFLERIRQQPSTPVLALLERRLRRYDAKRLADRASKGELLCRLLKDRVVCPGGTMAPHTHWLFPVLVDDPDEVISQLRQSGFDATQGQSLCVVAPPAERPELDPSTARHAMAKIVFLPIYPEMPKRAVRKMAMILLRGDRDRVHGTSEDRPPSRAGRRAGRARRAIAVLRRMRKPR
jgi:dTDP-4-amino-4,6-dideoxygalactose transaminase